MRRITLWVRRIVWSQRVYELMASRLRGQRMPSSGAGGGGSPPPRSIQVFLSGVILLTNVTSAGLSPRIYILILLAVFTSSFAVLRKTSTSVRQHNLKPIERTSDTYQEKLRDLLKQSADEVRFLETNGRWTADRPVA